MKEGLESKEQPLYVLENKNLITLNLKQTLSHVEIYTSKKVIVVEKTGRRVPVHSYDISLPTLRTKEDYEPYFDHAYLTITQLSNDDYTLKTQTRGLGGGAGNSKGSSNKQEPNLTKEDKKALKQYARSKGIKKESEISSELALEFFVSENNQQGVKAIVDVGWDINGKDFEYDTFLHRAVIKRLTEMAKFLIQRGAAVNAQDRNGSTSLNLAFLSNNIPMARILIANGADVNVKDSHYGSLLHRLIVDPNYTTPFIQKELTETNLIADLLQKGLNLSSRDKNGHTPLHMALVCKNIPIAMQLVRACASVNEEDPEWGTFLHRALMEKWIELALLLIEKGANLHVHNKNLNTPLHLASASGNNEIVLLLIKRGANLDAVDKQGNTPLNIAIFHNNTPIATALVKAGGDIRRKDNQDGTILHHSISEGLTELSLLLIQRGADINARDKNGNTPIRLAEIEENKEVIEALIKAGALKDTLKKSSIDSEIKNYAKLIQENKEEELNFTTPYLIRHFQKWNDEKVTSIVQLRDGQIASASNETGIIKIWDIETGRCIKELTKCVGARALAVMPKGLLACGAWGTVEIWDVKHGKIVQEIKIENGVYVLVTHPKGYLLAGNSDGKIFVWDIANKKIIKTLIHASSGHISDIKVLADGSIASVDWSSIGGSIKIWDTETWESIQTIQGIDTLTNAIAALPDGKIISARDGLKIWDSKSKELIKEIHDFAIRNVANMCLLANGYLVVEVEYDGIKIFSTQSWVCLNSLKTKNFRNNAIASLRDNRLAVAHDESITIWQIPEISKFNEILPLLELLKKNTSIKQLNLHGIDIQNENISDIINLLQKNTAIQIINLGNNKISKKDIDTLIKGISTRSGIIEIIHEGKDIKLDEHYYRDLTKQNEKEGNYQEAIAALTQAIQLKTSNSLDYIDYHNRAKLYEKMGNYEAAINGYNHLINFEQKDFYYSDRAELYIKLGLTQKAIEDFTKAIERSSSGSEFYYQSRAQVKASIGLLEDALADYQQAITINDNNDGFYLDCAEVCIEQGNYKKAVKHYKQAIKLNPKATYYYVLRAQAKLELSDYQDAIKDLTKAISFHPGGGEQSAFCERGFIKMALKQN